MLDFVPKFRKLTQTALVGAFIGAASAAEAARAISCHAEIDRVQRMLDIGDASLRATAESAESVDAMPHRQPTAGSVAGADTGAANKTWDALDRAIELEAKGDERGRVDLLRRIAPRRPAIETRYFALASTPPRLGAPTPVVVGKVSGRPLHERAAR